MEIVRERKNWVLAVGQESLKIKDLLYKRELWCLVIWGLGQVFQNAKDFETSVSFSFMFPSQFERAFWQRTEKTVHSFMSLQTPIGSLFQVFVHFQLGEHRKGE